MKQTNEFVRKVLKEYCGAKVMSSALHRCYEFNDRNIVKVNGEVASHYVVKRDSDDIAYFEMEGGYRLFWEEVESVETFVVERIWNIEEDET